MTDLHSHILPGIDDGASDLPAAMRLLELERKQGVRNIALTSHYNCEKMSVEKFLEERAAAYDRLLESAGASGADVQLKLGSEVFFSAQLMQMDVRPLCLEGTSVLLLELPVHHRPQFLREVLYELQSDGIIPLIAHVERYPYVLEDPTMLADWVEMGAYAQVNAAALLREPRQKQMVLKLMKWGLVHVVASDTHAPDRRPPRMREAMKEIEARLGSRMAMELRRNADRLFAGQELDGIEVHYPRQCFGRWV